MMIDPSVIDQSGQEEDEDGRRKREREEDLKQYDANKKAKRDEREENKKRGREQQEREQNKRTKYDGGYDKGFEEKEVDEQEKTSGINKRSNQISVITSMKTHPFRSERV